MYSKTAFAFVSAIILLVPEASAASIAGSFATIQADNANLTAIGTLDWRIWDDFDASNDDISGSNRDGNWWTGPNAQLTPTYNRKFGGSAIGDLSSTATGTQDSFFSPAHDFDYTDGTVASAAGTAAETIDNPGVSIVGTFAGLAGGSLSFDVTTVSTQEHTLLIYGMARRTDAELTLSLPGATTVVDEFDTGSDAGTNFDWIYTATFTPDNAGDVLTITLDRGTNSSNADDSFNSYRIGAAALSVVASPIPEPSTGLLALIGIVGLVMRRRR